MIVAKAQGIRLLILKAYAREMLKKVSFEDPDLEDIRVLVSRNISRIPLNNLLPWRNELYTIGELSEAAMEGCRDIPKEIFVLDAVIFLWVSPPQPEVIYFDDAAEEAVANIISKGLGISKQEGMALYDEYVVNALSRLNPG